jgi:hypothetical protein
VSIDQQFEITVLRNVICEIAHALECECSPTLSGHQPLMIASVIWLLADQRLGCSVTNRMDRYVAFVAFL